MKKGSLIMVLALCVIILAGCEVKTGNRITAGKDVQTFTYAYVSLDGKEIVKGFITQWRDYDDSDVVQVMIDGKYYLQQCGHDRRSLPRGVAILGQFGLWGERIKGIPGLRLASAQRSGFLAF